MGFGGTYYFIAQTKPWAERYAFEFLTNRRPYSASRFHVYWPRIQVEVRHAGRSQWVERSFLSRLLFVRDDGRGTDELRCAPGVSHLLKFRVPQYTVDQIQAREVGGFVRLDADAPRAGVLDARQGDKLKVSVDVGFGEKEWLSGVFQHRTSENRAVVFVSLMRGMQRTEVDLDRIELV